MPVAVASAKSRSASSLSRAGSPTAPPADARRASLAAKIDDVDALAEAEFSAADSEPPLSSCSCCCSNRKPLSTSVANRSGEMCCAGAPNGDNCTAIATMAAASSKPSSIS